MKKANLYKRADVLDYEAGTRTLTLNYNGRVIITDFLEVVSKELHNHDYAEGVCKFTHPDTSQTFSTECELIREGQEWVPLNGTFTTVEIDQPKPVQLFRKFIQDIQTP